MFISYKSDFDDNQWTFSQVMKRFPFQYQADRVIKNSSIHRAIFEKGWNIQREVLIPRKLYHFFKKLIRSGKTSRVFWDERKWKKQFVQTFL